MKTLIIYGTNSGGTLEASEIIRDTLVDAGHAVDLKNAKDAQPTDLEKGHDVILLGSCTWEVFEGKVKSEGQLQQDWLALRDRLAQTKTPHQKYAVFALGDSSYAKFAGAADHLEVIVQGLGGAKVGETLRVDGFYFHHDARNLVIAWAKSLGTV